MRPICPILETLWDGIGVARGHGALHPLAPVVARHRLVLGVNQADAVKDQVLLQVSSVPKMMPWL